jgi:hypothetical protein
MSTAIIPMKAARKDRQDSYGVLFEGMFVYDVTGKGLHSRHHPHRVVVWDNTRRPNPRNGEPVRYGQYGKLDGGDGKYLDPSRNATDAEQTIILDAESIAITSNGTNTGTAASGQVYGPVTLTVGQYVVLIYPDGTTSDPLVITARPLRDPELLPIS